MRRRLFDRLFTVAAGAAAALAVGVLLGVVGLVTARGAGALSLTFLTEQVRSVGAEGGIFFQAVGTLILVATAAAFAVPVAAATALGVALYAPRSLRRPLEAALHHLHVGEEALGVESLQVSDGVRLPLDGGVVEVA